MRIFAAVTSAGEAILDDSVYAYRPVRVFAVDKAGVATRTSRMLLVQIDPS